jgi:hypothetical protein
MIDDPVIEYLGRCDELRGDAGPLLHAFDESRAPLSYRKFARLVGREAVESLEQRYGPLAGNFTIRCYTGRYDGREVVCLMHSGYHHLWAMGPVACESQNDAPLPGAEVAAVRLASPSKWVPIPPESPEVYLSAREEHVRLRSCYIASGDQVIASSRLVPAHAYSMPEIGAWRVDEFEGLHGHEVAQLQCVPVEVVGLVEEDWSRACYAEQVGKAEDARRYAEWIRAGHVPPPVEIVETDRGEVQLAGDGHRRLAAHKLAGCSHIFAWVSPCMDHPQGLRRDGDGPVLRVGMTYEGIFGRGFSRKVAIK